MRMGTIRMLNRLLPVLLCALVMGQVQPKPEDTPQPYTVSEAYEVYSTLLPEDWTWRVAQANTLVLRAETVGYEMCLDPDAASKKILGPAIADYTKVNQNAGCCCDGFRSRSRTSSWLRTNCPLRSRPIMLRAGLNYPRWDLTISGRSQWCT